jgi:hypothetical protein
MLQMWMDCKLLQTVGVLDVRRRAQGAAERRRWTFTQHGGGQTKEIREDVCEIVRDDEESLTIPKLH